MRRFFLYSQIGQPHLSDDGKTMALVETGGTLCEPKDGGTTVAPNQKIDTCRTETQHQIKMPFPSAGGWMPRPFSVIDVKLA